MEPENPTDFAALLEPSTPSRAEPLNDSSADPTPLRYFFSDDNATGDAHIDISQQHDGEDDQEENDSIETVEIEKQVQLVTLRILGKPFPRTFWFRDWPVAALLGAFVGIGTLAFLAAVHLTLDLWFPGPSEASAKKHVDWMSLILTSCGGFVCGIILLIPQAPSLGTMRTMYHDAIDLKVRTV